MSGAHLRSAQFCDRLVHQGAGEAERRLLGRGSGCSFVVASIHNETSMVMAKRGGQKASVQSEIV